MSNHAPLQSNSQAQSAFALVAAGAHHVGFALVAVGLANWGAEPDGHTEMQARVANQQFDTLSLAPISFAAASAVSSVDVCAAAAYRFCIGAPEGNEFDLRRLEQLIDKSDDGRVLRSNLESWVQAVSADGDYAELKAARNRMVHKDMPSSSVVGSGPGRTMYPVGGALVTPEVVTRRFSDFAIRHYEHFVDAVLADFV
ncbi:hypothetical protein [Nocardia puris]|uniref:hypothetical protein n=1 Tax=Nocardia puris TaxID=208602 RepID=UPI002E20EAF4